MDRDLQRRLVAFVRPLYQDLDGVSRLDDIERIGRIARAIYTPSPPDARHFELLLLFQGLGKWLEKVGNASRTALNVAGITEAELRAVAASIARLDAPESEPERAVGAAILADNAGLRGLAQRFSTARREGHSITDVVREAVTEEAWPEWLPAPAIPILRKRLETRRRFCHELLEEL